MAPRTVRFEARDVFNLPLSEGFLVLDARGDDAYERAHLSGAWCLTPDLDELLRIVDDENPPEQLSTVLVCAAPGDGDGVARRLLEALGDGVLEAPDDAVHQPPDDAEDAFPSLRSRLARRLERVAFFEETEAFVESFPFLAVSGPEPLVEAPPVLPALLVAPTAETGALYGGRATSRRIGPSRVPSSRVRRGPAAGRHVDIPRDDAAKAIENGLRLAERGQRRYLGSQTHALSGEGLEILRVGAIVNATEEVRFHEAPRARLRCPLRDDETCGGSVLSRRHGAVAATPRGDRADADSTGAI